MLWVLALMSLSPVDAAHVAAQQTGAPVEALLRVCRRESRCQRIGVHAIDSHLDGYGGQVRLGHLDPACQARAAGPWSTWGAWGLSAASNWPYLPDCYQPEHLAIPIVSALAAGRKWQAECAGQRRARWCPRLKTGKRPANVELERQPVHVAVGGLK